MVERMQTKLGTKSQAAGAIGALGVAAVIGGAVVSNFGEGSEQRSLLEAVKRAEEATITAQEELRIKQREEEIARANLAKWLDGIKKKAEKKVSAPIPATPPAEAPAPDNQDSR